MDQFIAANSAAGQYLVDQNLSQRFLANNQNSSSKIYPGFLNPNNQAPLNLYAPTNSNHHHLFNATNQLNSSLNGNTNNNGLNTQHDKSKMNFQLVNQNPSAFYQNFPPEINRDVLQLNNLHKIEQQRERENQQQQLLNSKRSNLYGRNNLNELNSPQLSLAFLNHVDKQSLKINSLPFQNHLINSDNQNNGHFLHSQLQQQANYLQQNKSSPSNQHQLDQNQFNKNFQNSNQFNLPSNLHNNLSNSNNLSQLHSMPYFNSPICLNNKRPKLNTENKFNPLNIDTYDNLKRENYNPQVEAISPTNLDDKQSEQRRNTKDEILHNLHKIDREIKQTDGKISKLKKNQKELQALTNSSNNQIENLDPNDLKQLSTTQQVYTENRKKAIESQKKLDKLRPLTIAPLYNQPSDLPFYYENKKKFKWFKPKLIKLFKKRLVYKKKRDEYLTTQYERLMSEWLKNTESKQICIKKSKEAYKSREYFEKQFQELKRAREEKQKQLQQQQQAKAIENSNSNNENELDQQQQQQSLDNNEQDSESKRMRSLAVIPPILLDKELKKPTFFSKNGLIEDPVSEYKELAYVNTWRDSEKEIFKEKFLQTPKNFGLISNYLENKSVMDCVQFYYSSKKHENYKQQIRKNNAKKRTRAIAKQQIAEQKAIAKQQELLERELLNSQANKTNGINLSIKSTANDNQNTENQNRNDNNQTTSSSSKDKNEKELTENQEKLSTNEELNKENDSKDDENLDRNMEVNNNLLRCCLCKIEIDNVTKSYAITKYNYQLFNLNPDDLQPDHRVCLNCKFKSFKGLCPVTTCKFHNNDSSVKLKTLPIEWFDLTPELRYTYSAELNFPLDCKHCCSRCWILLIRKYGHILKYPLEKYLTTSWQKNEIDTFKTLLCQHGRNWNVIASILKTKTIKHCKEFYFYFKYQLDLKEFSRYGSYNKSTVNNSGVSTCGNSSDSDEYYSTEFTEIDSDEESLDDLKLARKRSRRTNSFIGADGLLSLSKRHSSSNLSIKSDCLSDATLSADEETDYSNDQRSNILNQHHPRIPISFMINPNAPTTSKTTLMPSPANIPISLANLNNQHQLINQQLLNNPNLTNQQLSQLHQQNKLLPNLNNSNNSQSVQLHSAANSAFNSVENLNVQPTCVRDLIYKTIDISLQSLQSKQSKQSPVMIDPITTAAIQQQTNNFKLNKSGLPTNPSPVPLPAHSNINLNNFIKPVSYSTPSPHLPLNLHNSNNSSQPMPLNLKATSSSSSSYDNNYLDEVQDLSKKTIKKDPYLNENYDQPKNLSLKPAHTKTSSREIFSIPSNLHGLNQSMPPPAHSHVRTPNLDSVSDLSRHRESPQKSLKSSNSNYQSNNNNNNNLLGRVPTPTNLLNNRIPTPNQLNQMRLTPTQINSRNTPTGNLSSISPRLTPTNNLSSNHQLNKQSPVNQLQFSQQQQQQQQQFQQQQKSKLPLNSINLGSSSPLNQNKDRHIIMNSPIGGSIVQGRPIINQPSHLVNQTPNMSSNSKPLSSLYHHSNSVSPIHLSNLNHNNNLKANEALLRPMSAQPNLFNLSKEQQQQLINQSTNEMAYGAGNNKKLNDSNLNNLSNNQLVIDFTTSKYMRNQQDNLNNSLNNNYPLNQAMQQHFLNSQYGKLTPNEINALNALNMANSANKSRSPLVNNIAQDLAKQQSNLPYQTNIKKGYNPPKSNTPIQIPQPNIHPQLIQSHPTLTQQQQLNLQASLQHHHQQLQQLNQQQHNLHHLQSPIKPDNLTIQNQNVNRQENPTNLIATQNYNLQKSNNGSERLIDAQSHDAFQALVNAAVAQKSIVVPEKSNDKKIDIKSKQIISNSNNQNKNLADHYQSNSNQLFNQINQQHQINNQQNKTLMKMPQNLFSKEKFEKEFRQQEQSNKLVPPVINLEPNNQPPINLADQNKQIKKDLIDNEVSQIYSQEALSKNKPMTTANLIEQIVTHSINNQSDSNKLSANSNLPSTINKFKESIANQFNNQMKIQNNTKISGQEDIKNEDSAKKIENKSQVPQIPQQKQISEFGVPTPFNYSAFANASKKLNEKEQKLVNNESFNKTTAERTSPSSSKSNESSKNLMNNIQFDYVGNKIFETMKKESNEIEITSSSSSNLSITKPIVSSAVETITNPTTSNPQSSVLTTVTNAPIIKSTTNDKSIAPSMPLLVSNKKQIKSKDDNKKIDLNSKSNSNNKIVTSSDDNLKKDKLTTNKRILDSTDNLINNNGKKIKLQEIASSSNNQINELDKLKNKELNETIEKINREDVNIKLSAIDVKKDENKDVNNKKDENNQNSVIDEKRNNEQHKIDNNHENNLITTTFNITNKTDLISSTVDSTTKELTLPVITNNNDLFNLKEKNDNKNEDTNNKEENYLNNNDLDNDLYSPSTPGEMVIDESIGSPVQEEKIDEEEDKKELIKNRLEIATKNNLDTITSTSSINKIAEFKNEIKNIPFSSTQLEFNEKQLIDNKTDYNIEKNLSIIESSSKKENSELLLNQIQNCSNEILEKKDLTIKTDKINDSKEELVINLNDKSDKLDKLVDVTSNDLKENGNEKK